VTYFEVDVGWQPKTHFGVDAGPVAAAARYSIAMHFRMDIESATAAATAVSAAGYGVIVPNTQHGDMYHHIGKHR